MELAWLWIPATIAAAAFQAGRNAAQRSLTGTLGTLGATQVRFLFGFPFALLFLAVVLAWEGHPAPGVNTAFLGYILAGAITQIAATALMLAAMKERSFVTVTAWIKTEPIQVALFGMAVLGDPMSWLGMGAILLASVGVVLMSRISAGAMAGGGSWRPIFLGLFSGSMFAISVVFFRGAILQIGSGSFVLDSTWALVWSLGIQVLLLMAWMLLFDRKLLVACARAWLPSIPGGFLGASASQCWFLAFALTSAANVRTLGLIEVLFAQMISRSFFAQTPTRRETVGIVLIVAGVALLVSQAS
ncbi:EamA family transporter [Kerstersia similis]